MKFFRLIFLLIIANSHFFCHSSRTNEKTSSESIPTLLKGKFMDDYGIQFTINDSVWTQHPNVNYHIISWDTTAQFILAKNDNNNPGDPGLFTRIDYMLLPGMEPFNWGFCLTVYKAKTIEEAQSAISADRLNPKKGCNGYPFSRMKRTEVIQYDKLKDY